MKKSEFRKKQIRGAKVVDVHDELMNKFMFVQRKIHGLPPVEQLSEFQVGAAERLIGKRDGLLLAMSLLEGTFGFDYSDDGQITL